MENQQQQNTPLCRANCGFYGSPATEDLCSKCFKDMIKRKQETGTNGGAVAQQTATSGTAHQYSTTTGTPSSGDAEAAASTSDSTQTAVQSQSIAEAKHFTEQPQDTAKTETDQTATPDNNAQPQKKPNRCWTCNKRVGLTGFECRCGGVYCGEHRYDSAHNCTFDYKSAARDELRKKNPQVISDKIQKI